MKYFHIGTSGYNYKDWKEKFYPKKLPQKQWLSYYAKEFSTVEINGSFYKTLSQDTYKRWSDEVPDTFQFVLKGPRFITHMKKIKDVEDAIERFFTSARPLGKKFKIALWQFPEYFTMVNEKKERFDRLERFLSDLPATVKHVFEFRHESWFVNDIFALLEKYKAGFVINDSPAFPTTEKITGDIVYIRFHGPGKLYATSYSDEQLKLWAGKIRKYLKKYDVYCYFNNDLSGYAIENAKTLQKFINLK